MVVAVNSNYQIKPQCTRVYAHTVVDPLTVSWLLVVAMALLCTRLTELNAPAAEKNCELIC